MLESKQKTRFLRERRGKRYPRGRHLPESLAAWPEVPGPSESIRLVDGELAASTSTGVLPVTTAALVAVGERSLGARAVVSAVASVTVLETGVLVSLLEALGGAGGGGHVVGGERVRVEGTLAGVVGVAALVNVALVLVVTAGRGGCWRLSGSLGGVDVFAVDVDHTLTTAGLGRVARAGLGAFADVEQVGVDKVVSAVAFAAPFDTGKTESLGVAGGYASSGGVGVRVGKVTDESAVGGVILVAADRGVGTVTAADAWGSARGRNGSIGGGGVNLIMPCAAAYLVSIAGAREVALLSVEGWSQGGHGVVAAALVAVDETGNDVVGGSASFDAVFDGHGGDRGRDVVIEGRQAALELVKAPTGVVGLAIGALNRGHNGTSGTSPL